MDFDPVDGAGACRVTCLLCSLFGSASFRQPCTGCASFQISHPRRSSIKEPKPVLCLDAADALLPACPLGFTSRLQAGFGGRPTPCLVTLLGLVRFYAGLTEVCCYVQQQGVSSSV